MRTLRFSLGILLAVVVSPAISQSAETPNYPTQPIELKYYANGPWHPAMINVPGCASKPVDTPVAVNQTPQVQGLVSIPLDCEIYFPTELGSNLDSQSSTPFKHPIVIRGNGTGALQPGQYAYWFNHLVSWGFVVIRTNNPTELDAKSMISSLNYLIGQNSNSSSPFYQKLDLTEIGAAGHSQGAAGALNAMTQSNGQIRTALSFDIPFNGACISECASRTSLEAAGQGSVLYLSGSDDLISRDQQTISGPLNSNTAFYEDTPETLVKAKAILIGGNHDAVQGTPTCVQLCGTGAYGFMAYPTAWLMWQLRGAQDGRQVFRNQSGEIFQETKNWQSVRSNVE